MIQVAQTVTGTGDPVRSGVGSGGVGRPRASWLGRPTVSGLCVKPVESLRTFRRVVTSVGRRRDQVAQVAFNHPIVRVRIPLGPRELEARLGSAVGP